MKANFIQQRLGVVLIGLGILWLAGCAASTPARHAAAKASQIKAAEKKKPVMYRKIAVSIRRGKEISTVYLGLFNLPSTKLYWHKGDYLNLPDAALSRRFREAFEAANYEVVGEPEVLYGDASEWRADLLVAGLVSDLKINPHFNYGGSKNSVNSQATASLKVAWQVYSRPDQKVVLLVTTEGASDQAAGPKNGGADTITDAFFAAVRNLAAEQPFHDLVVPAHSATQEGASVAVALKNAETSGSVQNKLPGLKLSVAAIFAGNNQGSGFVISDDGYLLSSQQVVGNFRQVKIKFATGVEVDGEVVSRHRGWDVALVKCAAPGLKGLPVRRERPATGEKVCVVGRPGPESQKPRQPVTQGIVSGFRNEGGMPFIQSDAAINAGNAGGPLVDQNGNVVGLAVQKRFNGQDQGLFVPIDEAMRALAIK